MYNLSNIKYLLAHLPKLYMNITQAVVSLVAQLVKNLPAVQETWVRSLGQEDGLEKEMATHSSVLAWKTLMHRGAWRATVNDVARVRHN